MLWVSALACKELGSCDCCPYNMKKLSKLNILDYF